MISLAAPTYDPAGHLALPTRFVDEYQAQRRGSVTATLDGGVAVFDSGYSLADQIWTASVTRPTRAQLARLQYLIAYYSELVVCCESGAYVARCEMALSKNILTLAVRPLRRLDS